MDCGGVSKGVYVVRIHSSMEISNFLVGNAAQGGGCWHLGVAKYPSGALTTGYEQHPRKGSPCPRLAFVEQNQPLVHPLDLFAP